MEPDKQKENPTEGMSVTEKRKYFEREIQHHVTGAHRKGPTKQFSYLADHEVERMKQEDEQKASNMSHEELLEYMSPDHETEYNQVLASLDPSKNIGQASVVRTVKAEKRMMAQMKVDSDSDDEDAEEDRQGGKFSSPEERAREAEKRAAWRKARMKSLDDAALRAKAVIDKANELSQNISTEEAKQKANQLSTLDIEFADADSSEETGTTQNGESAHNMSSASQPVPLHKAEGPCFGSLTLHKTDGDTTVRESVKVLDEKVSEHTEEVFDESQGKKVLKTFKVIEKTLEHEVEVTKKQIYELKLEDGETCQRISSNDSRR